jgi:hypothetical protein
MVRPRDPGPDRANIQPPRQAVPLGDVVIEGQRSASDAVCHR